MRKLRLIIFFLMILAYQSAARAQNQSFIPVEGPDLRARMDAAIKLARSNSQRTRFWTAYSFDVRPGVAVDFETVNDDGSRIYFQGSSIFSTNSSVETRNLGVFLLHEPDGGAAFVRVEVYNLERRHEYSGYPVYWLGRAGNEESLNLLRGLVETNRTSGVAERSIFAIALHDDARVSSMLENFIRSSSIESVRTKAIFWLGQTSGSSGGLSSFLADLVRNEQEGIEVRKQAASALGHSRDVSVFATLQSLYGSVQNRELKKRVLSAIAVNGNSAAAVNLLIKIANSDPEPEMRRQALQHLGHKAGQRSLGVLAETVGKIDAETEVQMQAVVAISRRPKDEAVPLLIRVARTHPKGEVRKQAIFSLARTGDERALEFFKEILREKSPR